MIIKQLIYILKIAQVLAIACIGLALTWIVCIPIIFVIFLMKLPKTLSRYSGYFLTFLEAAKESWDAADTIAQKILENSWLGLYLDFIVKIVENMMKTWETKYQYSFLYIRKNLETDDVILAEKYYNSYFADEEQRIYLRIRWNFQ